MKGQMCPEHEARKASAVERDVIRVDSIELRWRFSLGLRIRWPRRYVECCCLGGREEIVKYVEGSRRRSDASDSRVQVLGSNSSREILTKKQKVRY
jgi:hypothetical protein